jgi:hypothetical protein
MNLIITGFYAGLLALLLLIFTVRIIQLRLKLKVGLGDGQKSPLIKAIRIHGNFIEYIPFTLLLLAIYELNGGSVFILHGLGMLLIVARIAHAIGLTKSMGTSGYRQFGALATFIVIIALAILNITHFIQLPLA